MIIDAHTHIDYFGRYKGRSLNDLLLSMNESHIDTSLIIASVFGKKGTLGAVSNGPSTDYLIKKVKNCKRLKIIGNVNYTTLDDAQIEQLKNHILLKNIVGIKCYPGYEYYYPTDKKLFPLYSFCSENKCPIIFHTGFLPANSRGLLKYSLPLNIDEIATIFPKLKIVIAHMGNPWINDCAAVIEKHKNVYTDLSGQFSMSKKITPKEIESFYKNINLLESLVGLEKCLFGTDWWFQSQNDYLQIINNIPSLTPKIKDYIFWKNAKFIFNL